MTILPLKRGGLSFFDPPATRLVKPRWLARLWAKLFGYFWLPCEICNQPFAGFEWGESLEEFGRGTCARPECRAEVKRRNAVFFQARANRDGFEILSIEPLLLRRGNIIQNYFPFSNGQSTIVEK